MAKVIHSDGAIFLSWHRQYIAGLENFLTEVAPKGQQPKEEVPKDKQPKEEAPKDKQSK
jgi:tyrosinase-like protein